MKNIITKRLGAYLLDIIIVTLVSSIMCLFPINSNEKLYNNSLEKLQELQDKYTDEKITFEEYEKEFILLNQKIDKYSFPYTVVTVACLFGYFVLFSYYNNGQTLGKKIMKIRLVSNKKDKLTFKDYLIRGFVLNSILINLIGMVLLFILDKTTYYYSLNIVSIIETIFIYITICFMLFRKDNRGLHDIISNSKVIIEK